MLLAAIETTKKTGLPIHCHILEAEMVYTVLELLKEQNMDMSKFLWSHADNEGNLEAIKTAYLEGIWIGFDMIKQGTHAEKFELIQAMIELGYTDRLLLSQDYDFFEEVEVSHGKHPCCSLFDTFIPYCCSHGIDPKLIESILRENPSHYYNVE
jgi:predicted metal-dependent phosphotriesterase family hydrolase